MPATPAAPELTVKQSSPYVLGRDNVVGTLAGAITLLMVAALKQFTAWDIPLPEAMALQLVVQSAITHFTPPHPPEKVPPKPDEA
jgi:hypothetical protein